MIWLIGGLVVVLVALAYMVGDMRGYRIGHDEGYEDGFDEAVYLNGGVVWHVFSRCKCRPEVGKVYLIALSGSKMVYFAFWNKKRYWSLESRPNTIINNVHAWAKLPLHPDS